MTQHSQNGEGVELLPCPFCGWAEPKTISIRDGRVSQCPSCGARGAACFHGPADRPSANSRAISAWNARQSLAREPATADVGRDHIPDAGKMVEQGTSLGEVLCHCSEDDGVPDVGVSVGLGDGRALWIGELLKRDGGDIGLVFHGPDGLRIAAPLWPNCEWQDAADILRHHVGPALSRAAPSSDGERLRMALMASLAKRSQPTMDPPWTAAFNAALDMVARDTGCAPSSGHAMAEGERARDLLNARQLDRSTEAGRAAYRLLRRLDEDYHSSTYTEREDWIAVFTAHEPTRTPTTNDAIPDNVRRLVIAAREVFDGAGICFPEADALDKALEPFSALVPYENQPDNAALSAAPSAPATEAGKIVRDLLEAELDWHDCDDAENATLAKRAADMIETLSAAPTDQVKDGKGGGE